MGFESASFGPRGESVGFAFEAYREKEWSAKKVSLSDFVEAGWDALYDLR